MAVRASRRCLILASSAVLAVPLGAKGSELFSESVYVPPVVNTTPEPITAISGWNNLNILMWATPPLPTQDPTDTNTDAFAVDGASTINTNSLFTPVASDAGTFIGPGRITGNIFDRVTFAGSTPINQANIPNQGLSNPTNQVQFGLTGPTNNGVMNFLAQHWGGTFQRTFATSTLPAPPIAETDNFLRAVPIVNVEPHPAPPAAPPAGESFEYIVDFIQFTQYAISATATGELSPSGLGGARATGGNAGGGSAISGSEWVEFPFVPGQQPTFTYTGWADAADPIHFTVNQVEVSTTEIPLDDLNFTGDPPVGVSTTSNFQSEATPGDIVIATPEPAMGVMILGIVAITAGRGRRHR